MGHVSRDRNTIVTIISIITIITITDQGRGSHGARKARVNKKAAHATIFKSTSLLGVLADLVGAHHDNSRRHAQRIECIIL